MSVTNRSLPFWRSRRGQDSLATALVLLILCTGGIVVLLPFFWMLSTSLKAAEQVYLSPPIWLPYPPQFENYLTALTRVPFHVYAMNTTIIVSLVLVGTLLSCSFAAYGFARLRAPGKDFIFMMVLATLMLPGAVTLVPTYLMFNLIGWVGTFLPLIVPAYFGSAFFIFMLRQFYMTIPVELEEAAHMDGASVYRIWWSIILPLSKPVLATVSVFTFVGTYNDFFTPLIYLSREEQRTIAVALSYFSGSPRIGPQMHLMMAAVTVSIIPPLLLFIGAQRYFVRGIVLSGIKG
ncbi:MAG TPA: carbohydrate ABC transporter permease [Roseiflexaceae bacterium]|nr:carbohydrate ABC transporter permease [Roseiflexaceae bacterium]